MSENAVTIRPEALPTAPDPVSGFVATLGERWRLAQMIVQSGMAPKGMSPQGVMAVMLRAHELGIGPMQALSTVYWFDGRFCLAAALMDGLAVDRCGVVKQLVSLTDAGCSMKFMRAGWPDLDVSYTKDEAAAAGLTGKDNWRKNPRAMLLARCTARGIRLIAPDYFAGTYSIEEFGFDTDRTPPPPMDTTAAAGLTAQLEAAAGAEKPDGDGGKETSPVAAQDHPVKGHKDKAGATVKWTCPCGFVTDDADKADAHRDGLDS
jgi:hypothetical protein